MSALRAFLIALKVPQHEETLLGAGFDDVAAFATFDSDDVKSMEETLLAAGVPPGHHQKIMRTVRACQERELQHKGASPLKFDYGEQMPLLKILRDEVSALKQHIDSRRRDAAAQDLKLIEEHERWKEAYEAETQKVLEAKQVITALKMQLGAVEKQRAAAVEQLQAANGELQQAKRAAKKGRVRLQAQLDEKFEALHISMEAEAARADAAEKRADTAEKRADAAEERAATACGDCSEA